MEPAIQDYTSVVDTIIYMGSALGTIGILILGVIVKMQMGINTNRKDIEVVKEGLSSHEEECVKYREENGRRFDKVDRRLEEGSKSFREINRSLGVIEGCLLPKNTSDRPRTSENL